MKIDFKKIIEKRKIVLDNRKLLLDKIAPELQLSDPIQFYVSEIPQSVNARKKGSKVGVAQLNFLENIKGPVVYIFELVDKKEKIMLLEKLKRFRSKDNKDAEGNSLRRSTAKLPTGADKNSSSILYIGSVQEYIHSRVRQHLGFGHPHTFAIQLKFWAPPNLKLKFYYMQILQKELTYDIEAALAAELKPLIGKTEK